MDIAKRLLEIKPKLNAIRAARDTALTDEEQAQQAATTAETAHAANLKTELDASIAARTAMQTQDLANKDKRRKRQQACLEKAWSKLKNSSEGEMNAAILAIEAEQKARQDQGAKGYDDTITKIKKQGTEVVTRIESALANAKILQTRLDSLNQTRNWGLDGKNARASAEVSVRSSKLTLDDCEHQITRLTGELDAPTYSAKRSPSVFPIILVMTLLCGGGGYGLFVAMPGSPWLFAVVGGYFLSVGALWHLQQSSREKHATKAGSILQETHLAIRMLELYLSGTKENFANEIRDVENAEIQRICDVDETQQARIDILRKNGVIEVTEIKTRRDAIYQKILQRSRTEQARIKEITVRDIAALNVKHAEFVKAAQATHLKHKAQITQNSQASIERLAHDWNDIFNTVLAFVESEKLKAEAAAPLTQALSDANFKLPTAFPDSVYLGSGVLNVQDIVKGDEEGSFTVPGTQCAVPLELLYPTLGSLYIKVAAPRREAALQMILNTTLRLLCAFPAGKSKLTIIDPIGVGQNFGALMHLSDYDETLVNGKIWSDGAHLERKLSEMSEHIEKVTQKYLRNRYENITDFNREAGQMSVPYQFVILADFPTGLSELAIERLSTIINSGPRCGVFTLIHHNAAQKLPPGISEIQLKKNGLFLVENGENISVNGQFSLAKVFKSTTIPSSEAINTLMCSIGKQCQSAARVQVPFEVAAPPASEYWKLTTENSIRMPLGMAGADRLQYLELGLGTSQHALIAGKTGSGKSNLFHVIISNAALWYSPHELEFYLIDFKKGVEFKTYADHMLPHARVIAVESDREFGLSVLRRIDKELANRGDLFRASRVQDFPSYRAVAKTNPIPRTLLMIDEFQEFFTDDDAVSQEAALFLDRIVRQGRAFGIHVVLGTQTLGGTYSLAKSTLGQIAVRVALQCNEADSYLVLADDNGAAALLSRPGEAIYNDKAGFVEGNNPFQAVYLPRGEQDKCLMRVTEQTTKADYIRVSAPVVFEGNVLSDIRNNVELPERSKQASSLKTESACVWLGEANSIKGPSKAEFTLQGGSNLLFVGQRGFGTASTSILSLLASYALDKMRIVVLDGSNGDTELNQRLSLFQQLWPNQIEIVPHHNIRERLSELAGIIQKRQGGENYTTRIFLIVIGLERFRGLRNDDEFAYASPPSDSDTDANETESAGDPPAVSFGKILSDGPNEGVHSIVWCDSLTNLNRTFSRKALREFEMRVLYQMSTNDSSELIDSPAANRLGLYSAMLFTALNGAVEKFRPYSEVDLQSIRDLHSTLSMQQ